MSELSQHLSGTGGAMVIMFQKDLTMFKNCEAVVRKITNASIPFMKSFF